jgi:hypothetical protein
MNDLVSSGCFIDNNAISAYVDIGRSAMATLNLRNVPDTVHRQLRIQAARHGRSMESEARSILQAACVGGAGKQGADSLQQWVAKVYGGKTPRGVVEDLIAERRREAAGE